MKSLIFISLLIPFSAFAIPKVYFSSTEAYDHMCANGFDFANVGQDGDNAKLKKSWTTELKNRVSEFQKKWDEDSPVLFKILISEFKKDFSRAEYTASLSACAPAPSMPDPLVLNVSRFLKSYWENQEPKDMKYFVDTPFHELLHLWLFEHLPKDTPIQVKYRSEKRGVISHVHLFAIQSLIYEKANRPEVWNKVRAFITKAGGSHKRAMEILDKEGRDNILKELR